MSVWEGAERMASGRGEGETTEGRKRDGEGVEEVGGRGRRENSQ
jgi:hypothetical protein